LKNLTTPFCIAYSLLVKFTIQEILN